MSNVFAKWRGLNKDTQISIGASVFWYIALFPGRLGYDYSLATRMIHSGKSTDQWTSLYFWIFRILTFNGITIALISAMSLFVLLTSIRYFIFSLPISEDTKRRTFLYTACLPLIGAFGVNVSHDVLLAAGIVLLTGLYIRKSQNSFYSVKQSFLLNLLATVMLMTSFQGLVVVIINALVLLFRKQFIIATSLIVVIIALQFFSGFGITKNPPSFKVAFLIDDLKCVAQHPQARITPAEWAYLESLAPKSEWTKPISCSWPDPLYLSLEHLDKNRAVLNKDLVKNYLGIFMNNPLIVVQTHLQRSRGALPPPFFQGPDNQVLQNTELPVGYNTNIALQSGPGVLHPSIDEPSVHPHIAILKPLEFLAQASMFIFNQASWFWGWGALWLWPFIAFVFIYLSKGSIKNCIKVLIPTLVLHATLVLIGPAPLPRYVMSSTYMGIIVIIAYLIDATSRIKQSNPKSQASNF